MRASAWRRSVISSCVATQPPPGKRVKNYLDGPAILLFDNIYLMLVLGYHVQALAKVAFRVLSVTSSLHAIGEDIRERCAWFR